jgi:predicted transcriptional regulator
MTAQVCAFRRRGWTFQKIATELGITAPGAHYHWTKALKLRQQQMFNTIDEYRTEQLEEIEEQAQRLNIAIEKGGDEALAAESLLIKLREQKAKLMGTHAPIKVEGETTTRFLVTVEGVRSWHDDEAEGAAPGDTDDPSEAPDPVPRPT